MCYVDGSWDSMGQAGIDYTGGIEGDFHFQILCYWNKCKKAYINVKTRVRKGGLNRNSAEKQGE